MSTSARQATAFYREVAKEKKVWTVRDAGGFPAPKGRDGVRAQPFWSSRSRAELVIKNVPAYSGFTLVEISWDEFLRKWIPELSRDGFKVGVNWSGNDAIGYDLKPEVVQKAIEALVENPWWKRILR